MDPPKLSKECIDYFKKKGAEAISYKGKTFSQDICPFCGKPCAPVTEGFCSIPCYYKYQECQGQCLPPEDDHE